MQRSLSAIQPTGIVHIGNYIGAISQFVKLQHETEAFFFLVDYHAMTVPFRPEELHDQLLNAAAMYLACGVDPKKATIFQQSQVPQHTELAWILACITKMGEMERMTQFKDKASKGVERASVGLFTYPILMAADILLYDTNLVPVGEDQKQHVELARDLAERFNKTFGETFTVPQPLIKKTGARIMGLDDPTTKMSKSASSPKNYIALTDEDAVIRKKIASAVTGSSATFNPEKDTGGRNLLTIFSELSGKSVQELSVAFEGRGYREFKEALAEAAVAFISPIRTRHAELLANPSALVDILDDGSARARAVAKEKMEAIRDLLGIRL